MRRVVDVTGQTSWGEPEGAPGSGDPRHWDGGLQVDLGGPVPPDREGGVWTSWAPSGKRESEGMGGVGLRGGPGVYSLGTHVPERRLLASGLPRTILESNCLLIPSGCN